MPAAIGCGMSTIYKGSNVSEEDLLKAVEKI
jgi:hypothetical protein